VVWGLSAVLAAGLARNAWVLVGGLGILLFWAASRRLSRWARAGLAAVCVCVYGYGHSSIASYHHHISHFASLGGGWERPIWIDGWVASYPQPGHGSTLFEFVTAIDGTAHRFSVRATHFTIGYGDSLRLLVARPRSARAQDRGFLLAGGLCGSVRVVRGHVQRLPGHGGSWLRRSALWPAHDRLRQDIARGVGSRAAVPLALLLGERGTLDLPTREAFTRLGITHLLALSGQHLGFLAGALVLLMRAIRSRRRAWIVIALCFYVGLAGFILSLYRALVMVLILAAAVGVRRPLRPITALVDAFFLMLLAFPFALFSVGFQLSFLATVGVLVAIGRLHPAPVGRRHRAWHWVRSGVQVSVAAQLAVAPLLLFHFGEICLVAPITTALFVGPTVVLLFLGPVAAGAGAVLPEAGAMLFAALHHAGVVFDRLLLLCARVAPDPLDIPAPNPCLYFAGLALVTFSTRTRGRWVGMVALLVAWWPRVS
jgi:ComEC/Rec2-related protein